MTELNSVENITEDLKNLPDKNECDKTPSTDNTNAPITNNDEITTGTTNNIPDENIPPTSPSSSNLDSIFEPTIDMMVNDFDDEGTLEEEEALAAQGGEDPSAELSSLQKESDMPIEELLALYNCTPPSHGSNRSGGTKRGKKRRKLLIATSVDCEPLKKEKKLCENVISELPLNEDEKEIENCKEQPTTSNNIVDDDIIEKSDDKSDIEEEISEEKRNVEDDAEDELSDVDGETEIDGVGVDDDDEEDDDADSKEISHLSKLYPETYGRSGDKRLLRTISRQQSDEEEDIDYSPDEDEKKKTIMVGSEFQAVIPEGFSKYDDVLPYENEDKLLWDPSRLTEEQTEEYLTKAQEQAKINASNNNGNQFGVDAIPCGKHLRDDEQALYLLLQCGHNTEEALRRKRINPVPSTEQMSIWSEEECRNFESVLRLYGKDFHTIKHAKVHTRSVGELVQFYYLWKKTERHDVFANKARLEKKKYNLNPGLTDYMDRFLEELDTANTGVNATTNNNCNIERSSSPSASGGGGVNSILNVSETNSTIVQQSPVKLTDGSIVVATTSKIDESNSEIEINSTDLTNSDNIIETTATTPIKKTNSTA